MEKLFQYGIGQCQIINSGGEQSPFPALHHYPPVSIVTNQFWIKERSKFIHLNFHGNIEFVEPRIVTQLIIARFHLKGFIIEPGCHLIDDHIIAFVKNQPFFDFQAELISGFPLVFVDIDLFIVL